MKYSINIIRNLRIQEKKAKKRRVRLLALSVTCFGILFLSLFYSAIQVLTMHQIIRNEKDKLERVKKEYRQYRQAAMTVNKTDIELLDNLQINRIFWTKKVAALARHLPDNYWITSFQYKDQTLHINGNGYITTRQHQLVEINEYLNNLRRDKNFNDVFKSIQLESVRQTNIGGKKAVTFTYTAREGKN